MRFEFFGKPAGLTKVEIFYVGPEPVLFSIPAKGAPKPYPMEPSPYNNGGAGAPGWWMVTLRVEGIFVKILSFEV